MNICRPIKNKKKIKGHKERQTKNISFFRKDYTNNEKNKKKREK